MAPTMRVVVLWSSLTVMVMMQLFMGGVQSQTGDAPVVHFPGGASVLGLNYGATFGFLGIPFGKAARWADPVLATFTGQFSATAYGAYCPQTCVLPPGVCPMGTMSEDCLNLNVFTPNPLPQSAPVMVFFYGGGYILGGQETPLYNGSFLAASPNPVVVVAINYRLGALGFFRDANISGNFGMKDQLLALGWVQKHIAAFGGDPNNVMIFGQSAGGMSTMSMVLSPHAVGLFKHAAIHSDPLGIAYCSADEIGALSNTFTNLVGCQNNVTCLYDLPVSTILTRQVEAVALDPNVAKAIYQSGAPWEPFIDGDILPGQPLTTLPTGSYNRVPVMLGYVQNEGTMFVYSAIPLPLDAAEYVLVLDTLYGSAASTVRKMYPPLPPGQDNRAQLSQILTDAAFTCPIINASLNMINYNAVYLWRFNHSIDDESVWGPDFAACAGPGQVCHGSELPFVFGTLNLAGYPWGSGEQALSNMMITQWTNFATTSDPNQPLSSAPNWPLVMSKSTPTSVLDFLFQIPGSGAESNYRSAVCNQWNQIGYGHGSYYGASKLGLARAFSAANAALAQHRAARS